MRHFISFIVFITSFGVNSAEVPIIFVHGHEGEATSEYGWKTWYPTDNNGVLQYPTAMTKILSSHYAGYTAGSPLNCDIDSTPTPTGGNTRVIYNFSYYYPDGSRGVIGYSDSVLVLIKDDGSDTLFPYEPDYPKGKDVPAHYYQVWFPRYIPVSIYYMNTYIENWRSGKYAKRLADFIDKVLTATGASQVDIVAHSMGGDVVRSTMKYYGCSSKIRKVITIGTPHHPYSSYLERFAEAFIVGSQDWQKDGGEDTELGATSGGHTTVFRDLITGQEREWLDFLGYSGYGDVQFSTIAGNRGLVIAGHPNDGTVEVNQAHLDIATFKPVIYASHSYAGEQELAEVTCTYTTEFIKKWMIDDEVLAEATISGNTSLYPNPWPQTSGNGFFGALRCNVGVNSYQNVLSLVSLITTISGNDIIDVYGIPLYKCIDAEPGEAGDPVILANPGDLPPGLYSFRYFINDMVHGEIVNDLTTFRRDPDPTPYNGSYVEVKEPQGGSYYSGESIWIKWLSDEMVLSTDIYFSIDNGATYERIFHLGPRGYNEALYEDSVKWEIPYANSNSCKIKVVQNLDNVFYISDGSNNFSIIPPPPPTITLLWPNQTGISVEEGKNYSIRYNGDAAAGIKRVEAYLSRDGGNTFPDTLANPHLYDRPYPTSVTDDTISWDVTQGPTEQGKIKVIAYDPNDIKGYDVSSYNFSVKLARPSFCENYVPSYTSVHLAFNDRSKYEDEYIIERSEDGTNYTTIATVPGLTGTGIIEYEDESVQPRKKYYYRIKGKKGSMYSNYTTASIFTAPNWKASEEGDFSDHNRCHFFVDNGIIHLGYVKKKNTHSYLDIYRKFTNGKWNAPDEQIEEDGGGGKLSLKELSDSSIWITLSGNRVFRLKDGVYDMFIYNAGDIDYISDPVYSQGKIHIIVSKVKQPTKGEPPSPYYCYDEIILDPVTQQWNTIKIDSFRFNSNAYTDYSAPVLSYNGCRMITAFSLLKNNQWEIHLKEKEDNDPLWYNKTFISDARMPTISDDYLGYKKGDDSIFIYRISTGDKWGISTPSASNPFIYYNNGTIYLAYGEDGEIRYRTFGDNLFTDEYNLSVSPDTNFLYPEVYIKDGTTYVLYVEEYSTGTDSIREIRTKSFPLPPPVTDVTPLTHIFLSLFTIYTIHWNIQDLYTPVKTKIYITRDGGASWSYIKTLSGDPGEYTWMVTPPTTSNAQFRVEVYYDETDNPGIGYSHTFTIEEEEIPVRGKGITYQRYGTGNITLVNVGFTRESSYQFERNVPAAPFGLITTFTVPLLGNYWFAGGIRSSGEGKTGLRVKIDGKWEDIGFTADTLWERKYKSFNLKTNEDIILDLRCNEGFSGIGNIENPRIYKSEYIPLVLVDASYITGLGTIYPSTITKKRKGFTDECDTGDTLIYSLNHKTGERIRIYLEKGMGIIYDDSIPIGFVKKGENDMPLLQNGNKIKIKGKGLEVKYIAIYSLDSGKKSTLAGHTPAKLEPKIEIMGIGKRIDIYVTYNTNGKIRIDVYDTAGRRIERKEAFLSYGKRFISLGEHLPSGVYFVKVSGGLSAFGKVMVIK